MAWFTIGVIIGAFISGAIRAKSGEDLTWPISSAFTAAIILGYGMWTGWAP